jgi:AcrR family transcriptional regulator
MVMGRASTVSTRDVARTAVRAELAKVAFEMFGRDGFDKVTIADLAAAAGISQSTFLRYFRTKEDAVLSALDARGDQIAGALRGRPAGEDDWTALRRAVDVVIEPYHQDPAWSLAVTRLIQATPALSNRWRQDRHRLHPGLCRALLGRRNEDGPVPLEISVTAAAALDCLNIAIEYWVQSDGKRDLDQLLDEAFATLAKLRSLGTGKEGGHGLRPASAPPSRGLTR